MQFDCQGSSGFWSNNGHLLIQKILGCKTFKGGEKVTSLEGHDLFSEPLVATLAAKAVCLARRAVKFKTLEGGEFDLPCAPEALQSLMTALPLSRFDAAQVEAILLAR